MNTVLTAPFQHNAEHVAAELAWLNLVLHRAVLEGRAQNGGQPEPFKGLYLSDAEIDRLLRGAGAGPPRLEGSLSDAVSDMRSEIDARVQASLDADVRLALPQLGRMFGLSPLELRVVLLALAPELDLGYEKVFAYLQDDFNRRRPTVDLALRLFCAGTADRIEGRRLFAADAPLCRFGLLRALDRADGPVLSRPLIVDDLTAAFVLRAGALGGGLTSHARLMATRRRLDDLRWPAEIRERLLTVIRTYTSSPSASSQRLVCHFHGPAGTGRKTLAGTLCREAGVPLLVADLGDVLHRAANATGFEDGLRDLFRQAILQQAALYLENVECLSGEDEKLERNRRVFRHTVDELSWLTFLSTARPWSPGDLFMGHTFISIHLPPPGLASRDDLWMQLAAEADLPTTGVSWADLATRFRLTPGGMEAALAAARDIAFLRAPGDPLVMSDLIEGCYTQSNRRLSGLARKLPHGRNWGDLTLPPNTRAQLEELCAQVRHRRRVYEEWGFARNASLGKGLCALFHGPSGVGKTMAVEVIARTLQLEVYKIDLSLVVSKYIGETEKNLSRIFDEAETSNAILFFDEADALFGKRSEVKDAHDRYANIEINYLLQRIEEFEGLVILASNLRKNIDDGFFRRMHVAVEFPMPDASHRYRIWRQHFPATARIADDVDFAFLAERVPVAGGNIRNIVLNAAFLAADVPGEIRMEHLIRATRREYEKIGRICADVEFGPYQSMLRDA
jgi:AAA+ superfamily predicted ATPase